MPNLLTIVVSQGQSKNPVKRKLEEDLARTLAEEHGVEVLLVPHLYDLAPHGETLQRLRGVQGNLLVLSWLYPRATRWILDRNGIHGYEGEAELVVAEEEDEDEEEEEAAEDKERVIEQRALPPRYIYCIDMRAAEDVESYRDEVRRICRDLALPSAEAPGEGTTARSSDSSPAQQAEQQAEQWLGGAARPEQLDRFFRPTNDVALPIAGAASADRESNGQPATTPSDSDGAAGQPGGEAQPLTPGSADPIVVQEQPGRRWYPVIDFSRCTNCMECIDFCLFGVYGMDASDTILVEQPDNCRKGCPACSRVCPENAIIFPQHKTPAIAGSTVALGGLKIDLSKLFGAPEGDEDPMQVAARERDEQLVAAGRQAVGMEVGMPKRQAGKQQQGSKDELDDLLDELDELDL